MSIVFKFQIIVTARLPSPSHPLIPSHSLKIIIAMTDDSELTEKKLLELKKQRYDRQIRVWGAGTKLSWKPETKEVILVLTVLLSERLQLAPRCSNTDTECSGISMRPSWSPYRSCQERCPRWHEHRYSRLINCMHARSVT